MRGGMYNANKRKKELARKKKQEEKRLKRQKSLKIDSDTPEEASLDNSDIETPTNPDTE
jgi:hypothetical protein